MEKRDMKMLVVGVILFFGAVFVVVMGMMGRKAEADKISKALAEADESHDRTQDEYENKYPIMRELPIDYFKKLDGGKYLNFKIVGGAFNECEKNQEFCVKIIDFKEGAEAEALAEIKRRGYKPEDYEIIYEYGVDGMDE